jgi:DNA-binding IclR family transcriptional regulator
MATALAIAPSSAHRLLTNLVEEGYVQQDTRSQRYLLGPELMRWAHLIIARTPIRQIAIEHMRGLVDACNETALLGIYGGSRQEMMFTASVDSSHALRYAIQLNAWVPVYVGASGLAIMAFLPTSEINSIINRTRLTPLTGASITEPYRMEAALASIRDNGYAFSRGQRIPDAVGIAAPIFGVDGHVAGDIALTIPAQRFDERGRERLVELLLECTSAVSRDIGGVTLAASGNRRAG